MSRIFLVEDDEYISRVYERAFRLAGHEIEIKPDGSSAWATLSDAKVIPSVILLDIALPDMSGTELLDKIKKDAVFEKTPVVILTNSFDMELEQKLLKAGAALYLVKIDHEPKELVSRIESLIGST